MEYSIKRPIINDPIDAEIQRQKDEFAERVIFERKKNSWSQKELARIANLSGATIAHIENARRMVSCETLRALARAFKVSTDYLLGERPKNYDDLMQDARTAHVIRTFHRMSVKDQDDILFYIQCVEKRAEKTS